MNELLLSSWIKDEMIEDGEETIEVVEEEIEVWQREVVVVVGSCV